MNTIKPVFLGGTCNGSTWRDDFVKLLKVESFNPVVEDWTPECMEEEIRQREHCSFCVYAITPKMTGFYSIAEVVDDSNKRPEKTLFVIPGEYLEDGGLEFSKAQLKSLAAVADMVARNGGMSLMTLQHAADYINERLGKKE